MSLRICIKVERTDSKCSSCDFHLERVYVFFFFFLGGGVVLQHFPTDLSANAILACINS